MKQFSRYALPALAAAALVFSASSLAAPASGKSGQVPTTPPPTGVPHVKAPAPKPVNKNDASYVLGMNMAQQLPTYVRSELNLKVLEQAFHDGLAGKDSKFTPEQSKQINDAFVTKIRAKMEAEYKAQAAKNKRESRVFLEKNRKKPGVKVTSSGLQYEVIKRGTGAHPGPDDTVDVEYKGTLVDGKLFDRSPEGQSRPIPLSRVIPGFREGLELMQVGGHYKLFIPPELGYGEKPSRGFPPSAVLIFDVKLDKTTPPAPDSGGSSDGGN